ncbi:MAG: D-amino acid aminotransferase, partial [Alphaproteobacteria bacterium]|nr:D-amino acid aminotransferase [Alphaproteobacteria bacterium]
MSRVAYVNGRYAPQRDPAVEVEDRGFQFADGIYEVWAIAGGLLIDEAAHFARLERSLRELAIPRPMSDAALRRAARETLRRNRVRDGILYLQITRGA